MEVGVFIPIGNNGWLISSTSPQYKPSFDLNKQIVQSAESYGLDFALSMIKLRGFGGKTEFWDYNLESITLMAGLASVTEKIRLYATAATLVIPPAIAARMATTIDSISNGRFGLNSNHRLATARVFSNGNVAGRSVFRKPLRVFGGVHQGLQRTLGDGAKRLQGRSFSDGRLPYAA